MASISIVFFLLIVSFSDGRAQPKQPVQIAPGSSLYPTKANHSWLSPSGRFAFGFYKQGIDRFAVGIWLVLGDNITVVWTAFRDDDDVPFSSNARLDFTTDGRLLLRANQRGVKVVAAPEPGTSYASMLDSGNFVICDKDSKKMWQSFNHPTDTILGGQTLLAGAQLCSSLTRDDHSTGRFCLDMQEDDGNLVLYPVDTSDAQNAYWNTGIYFPGSPNFSLYLNNTDEDYIRMLIIDGNGSQVLFSNSLLYNGSSTDRHSGNANTIYRATLDIDGFFRLYSYLYDESGKCINCTSLWRVPDDQCAVTGFCGVNSYCTYNDGNPYCVCLPGTNFVDPNDKSLGCQRNFSEAGCRGGKDNSDFYTMKTMDNMRWGDPHYAKASMSEEECRQSCLEDCNCGAALFFFDGESCLKNSLPLRYIIVNASGYKAFLKKGMRSINETVSIPNVVTLKKSQKTTMMKILLVAFCFTVFSGVALAISGLFIFKSRFLRYKRLLENGNLGLMEEVTLRLFSYNELKRATDGFKEELGKGSFGAVYKGALYKGKRLVAVKRLEKLIEEGEREFKAEMRAIGRTHHKNLVRLLGYCAEDSRRLLVYEYMSNGSLADLLFRAQRRPNWNERVQIAQDIARGILYLHEECDAPIIHCDIKPQNILMDGFWTAKISDFGLAKFLMPDQTRTFTGVRGTRGYLAPEWQRNTPISVKADVYSYGIVILEIICCRRNMEVNVSNEDEIILSTWIYKCFVAGELEKIVKWEEVDKTSLENMVKVGLWCIQDEPALRPSMKSVLLMLEGNITDISVPPCPTATSM